MLKIIQAVRLGFEILSSVEHFLEHPVKPEMTELHFLNGTATLLLLQSTARVISYKKVLGYQSPRIDNFNFVSLK